MKKKLMTLLLTGALTLSGCSSQLPALSAGEGTPVSPEAVFSGATQTPTLTTPLVEELPGKETWARDQLPPELLDTYDRLNLAVACHQDTPVQVDATMDQVQQALNALRIDHPEYFWFEGQAAYVSTTNLLGETVSCELSYTMTQEEAQAALPQVEQYVTRCLSDLEAQNPQGDYEKILWVYRYIIANTDYVLEETDQSFLSVMTRGQGTCAGYSRTFQYLMHRLNIPCTLALGYGEGGESHGWNLVQCQGSWYHVDVTWGDPVDEAGAPGNSMDYTYFMVTDEEIFRDHSLDPGLILPECSATQCNYYRKAGLQLSQWDSWSYENLMHSALEQGDDWLTVRFDEKESFEKAMTALIENSGILTLFSNCGLPIPVDGITYSYNDIFYEFSVKLS